MNTTELKALRFHINLNDLMSKDGEGTVPSVFIAEHNNVLRQQ